MKYKEMTVWSAGEKCKTKKIEFILGWFIVLCWVVLCVTFFTQNLTDDRTAIVSTGQHILMGFCLSGITSIFGIVGYAMASVSLRAIKRNKEIKVYLYDFADFIKLGEVPVGKKVVFSDTCGVVLCDEVNYAEYRDWQGLSDKDLYFFKFEEFYERYKGSKIEVVLS